MNKLYITTAIPYVNSTPHIGFALEIIQADVIARLARQRGQKVHFLTGTDENALKNVQAAEKAGVPIEKFVQENAQSFADLKQILNLSYDDFIRTTEPRHFSGAQKLWQQTNSEDLYLKNYRGLYCVGCEAFYTPEELDANGECFEHPGKKLEEIEEENYFFKLSKYQDWLLQTIESGELEIVPTIRKNEVLAFIKQGLQDFSVSRSKERAHGWGVPVPDGSGQIFYVWYDALANYITALDYTNEGALFKDYWLDNLNKVHVIGKGITRFHAIYWPAMLKSAGLPIPNKIFAHGYITSHGQKISKSLGNTIDPVEQVQKYGTDAVRYFLLREIPSYGDGDYTEERFKEVYNADLANGLGNLVARVAKLCEKLEKQNFGTEGYANQAFPGQDIHYRPVAESLDKFRFDEALTSIWQLIKKCDAQIEKYKPWTLSGEDLWGHLDIWVHDICHIAVCLKPFLPETADKILKQYTGRIQSAPPLFPRLGTK